MEHTRLADAPAQVCENLVRLTYPEQLSLHGELACEEVDTALNNVMTLAVEEVDGSMVLTEEKVTPRLFAEGGVARTRLTESISKWDQVSIFTKHETEQPIEAFKIRGAFVACWQALQRDPNIRHFAAASAGNHGMGVAYFVQWYNSQPKADGSPLEEHEKLRAHIFCKETASQEKVGKISGFAGATVYQEGLAQLEDAAEAGKDFVKFVDEAPGEQKAYFVPPFDHPDVMAGQATVLLETVTQLQEAGVDLQSKPLFLYVALGGGGKACGNAVLMDRLVNLGVLHPDSCVVASQMKRCDGMLRAVDMVDRGEAASAADLNDLFIDADGEDSFDPTADGTAVRKVGELNLPMVYYLREKGRLHLVQVSKSELGQSMLRAQVYGRTLEPAGALADAGRYKTTNEMASYYTTHEDEEFIHVVVESGANVSQETIDDFVAASMEGHPLGGMAMRLASSPAA